ncbi:MAG TPA: MDR family MFS transporter [Stellaceae bacterium]
MAQPPRTVGARPTLPRFTRKEIVRIISGLILAMFLASLDQTIVATSLSAMAQDLNGWALMSWVVSAYLVASTVTTPLYGRLSDLYGRRPVLLAAILVFVGASVLSALSQSMLQLIGARALQGIGGGGLRAVSMAAVADVVPPRERGRYQGYFSSVWAMSSVLGPVLGGFFAQYLSWHWIFWINLPIGAAALWLCNRNLRRLARPLRKPVIDWIGGALILAATTPALVAVGRAEASGGWARLDIVVLLGAALVCAVALVAWERAAAQPVLPLRLFASRIFAVANVIAFTMSMVMIALIILVPLDFELVAGLPPDDAGIRLIPMTGATVLGSFIAGQLVSRTGRYRIYPIAGAVAMALACATISVLELGRSWPLDTVLTIWLGLSFGFQLPTITVAVQNALELEDTGIGLSVVMFFRLIGGAFGVALLMALLIGALDAQALAIPGHAVLGANPGLAFLHVEQRRTLSPALLAGLTEAAQVAFSHTFFYAAAISAVTAVAAFFFKEIPLRGR